MLMIDAEDEGDPVPELMQVQEDAMEIGDILFIRSLTGQASLRLLQMWCIDWYL